MTQNRASSYFLHYSLFSCFGFTTGRLNIRSHCHEQSENKLTPIYLELRFVRLCCGLEVQHLVTTIHVALVIKEQ